MLPSLSAAWMAKEETPDAGPSDAQVPHKARNSTSRPLWSQQVPVPVPFDREVTALSPSTT